MNMIGTEFLLAVSFAVKFLASLSICTLYFVPSLSLLDRKVLGSSPSSSYLSFDLFFLSPSRNTSRMPEIIASTSLLCILKLLFGRTPLTPGIGAPHVQMSTQQMQYIEFNMEIFISIAL